MTKKPSAGANTWVDPDDAPELTDEHFKQADLYDGEKLIRRGRPPTGRAKRLLSLRIDVDVLERLRGLGPGWQTQAAEALRQLADTTPGQGKTSP
jgi:uncharacterized protein (DUF4415 family)